MRFLIADVTGSVWMFATNRAGQPLFVKFGRTAQTLSPIPVKSKYNSMQVKVDRRMRGGLLLTNSYTLGRGYSYINGDGTGGTIATPASTFSPPTASMKPSGAMIFTRPALASSSLATPLAPP